MTDKELRCEVSRLRAAMSLALMHLNSSLPTYERSVDGESAILARKVLINALQRP